MDKKIISPDRKKYLRQIKFRKISVFITQIGILASFITLWEVLANLGIIDSFITSQPSRILNTFMNLSSNDLLMHLGVTLYETFCGFVFGTLLGICIAIILWLSPFLSKVFDPFLVVLNSLPKVALRSYHNYMGWVWHNFYYCYGSCNFTCCNNFRYLTRLFKYRQRQNKNGKNF